MLTLENSSGSSATAWREASALARQRGRGPGSDGRNTAGHGFDRAHSAAAEKLAAGMTEFETYVRNNREFIPNFGERYRQGERISTAFVESTINQVVSRRFVKKQQMQWSLKGAHLLLQTRTKVLNNELEDVFRGWYPQFRAQSAAT